MHWIALRLPIFIFSILIPVFLMREKYSEPIILEPALKEIYIHFLSSLGTLMILLFILSDLDLSKLLSSVNCIDPCIEFTNEVGKKKYLPFLGGLVLKYRDRFSTPVHKKIYPVSLYPHALSNHPPQQKVAIF